MVLVCSLLVSVYSQEPWGAVFLGWDQYPPTSARGSWELLDTGPENLSLELGHPTAGFRGQLKGDLRIQVICVLG